MSGFPTTLCVGVLWTYVQAPKLKVHGAAYQRLSNSPTSGLWAYLRGRTANASNPSLIGGVMLNPPILPVGIAFCCCEAERQRASIKQPI